MTKFAYRTPEQEQGALELAEDLAQVAMKHIEQGRSTRRVLEETIISTLEMAAWVVRQGDDRVAEWVERALFQGRTKE